MKAILAIFGLLISFSIKANDTSCIQRLTNDHSVDYAKFELDFFSLDPKFQIDYGKDHLAQGILMVRATLSEVGCARKDINFGKGPFGSSLSKCSYLVPGVESSLSCYIQSNLGYFNVTWDYLDFVHVSYYRWD